VSLVPLGELGEVHGGRWLEVGGFDRSVCPLAFATRWSVDIPPSPQLIQSLPWQTEEDREAKALTVSIPLPDGTPVDSHFVYVQVTGSVVVMPASPRMVIGYNHAASASGLVMVAAALGDLPILMQALKVRLST
jgi:hypothetical protein